MNSEHSHNKTFSISLDNKNISLNEIIDLDRFKRLDDRYIITNICKKLNIKYEFVENGCNVYYRSFVANICFDINNKLRSVSNFIDINLFKKQDEDKLISFMNHVIVNKDVNISIKYLRSIFNKILDNVIKECREVKDNVDLYVSKIVNINRELVFMLIKLK